MNFNQCISLFWNQKYISTPPSSVQKQRKMLTSTTEIFPGIRLMPLEPKLQKQQDLWLPWKIGSQPSANAHSCVDAYQCPLQNTTDTECMARPTLSPPSQFFQHSVLFHLTRLCMNTKSYLVNRTFEKVNNIYFAEMQHLV